MAGDIRGLLLCAGAATRFGGPKLMALARDNTRQREERVAVLAARHLLEGCGNALAVIRPGDGSLRHVLIEEGCTVLESQRSRDGMGESLADAVAATSDAAGWIVALGDMPYISPGTIALVRAQLEIGALLAAPVDAQGRRGHPVGFGSTAGQALLALCGDSGARLVVSHRYDAMVPVVVDDAGIFIDIDTREQLGTDHPLNAG